MMPRHTRIYLFAGICLVLLVVAVGTAPPRRTASAPRLGTVSAMPPATTTAPPSATLTRTPVGLSGWTIVTSVIITTGVNYLYAVAPIATNDVWAVGSYFDYGDRTLAEHWDGSRWSIVPTGTGSDEGNYLYAVAAVAANDVWAVGHIQVSHEALTLAEHWNGSQWTEVASPSYGWLYGVAAVGANDVWAVGGTCRSACFAPETTQIEHWDGSVWQIVPGPDPGGAGYLNGVTASAANDVWAVGIVGGHPLTEHWNGTAWTLVLSPGAGSLHAVAAIGPNDVWAVGDGGLLEHWNGALWSLVAGPGSAALYGVVAVSAANVWAVGAGGLIEHWDGRVWSVAPNPSGGDLSAVGGIAANDLWAVGSTNGQTLIEHYDSLPPTVTPTPTPCPAGQFHDVQPADYFYPPVQYLVQHGVISGYSDCTFRPYANTTRAQLAKIVVLGFALPISTPASGQFTFADVPATFPFFPYIETAAAHSLVSGYTCGGSGEPCDPQQRAYFRPYANVTRGQLSKITVVAAGWVVLHPAVPTFADVLPGTAFYPFVETAACHGIVSGYTCGGPGEPCDPGSRRYFRQSNNATRGQIAKIAYLAITGTGVCATPTAGPPTATATAHFTPTAMLTATSVPPTATRIPSATNTSGATATATASTVTPTAMPSPIATVTVTPTP